jgi:3-deoxy-D-manno-octulosonate 8-phosphate phosphatase (KDO 8-P phosphatase)
MEEHLSFCNPDAVGKAELLKAVIFDVDGVFTDNRVLEGGDSKPKWRSYSDGQGVSLLRAIGIKVCLVTNEKNDAARHITDTVLKWNRLPSSRSNDNPNGWHHVYLYTGVGGANKVSAVEEWFEFVEPDLSWEVCGAMGDDLVDVPLLRKAALKAAPVSAEWVVQDLVDIITRRPGGAGAVRDFANFMLKMRGIDPLSLPTE